MTSVLLTTTGTAWLLTLFVTQPTQQVHWGPEQWVPIIVAVVSSLGAVVAASASSRHSRGAKVIAKEVIRQLKIPSNGVHNGQVLEGIVQVQQIQGQLLAVALGREDIEIPNAIQIARQLSADENEGSPPRPKGAE